MNITNEMLLEIAREGAARFHRSIHDYNYATWILEGKKDQNSSVQCALHTARVMIEQGYVPRPSVEDINRACDMLVHKTWGSMDDYQKALLDELFPPLTPSRVQIVRERLRISDDITDKEILDVLEETEDADR